MVQDRTTAVDNPEKYVAFLAGTCINRSLVEVDGLLRPGIADADKSGRAGNPQSHLEYWKGSTGTAAPGAYCLGGCGQIL